MQGLDKQSKRGFEVQTYDQTGLDERRTVGPRLPYFWKLRIVGCGQGLSEGHGVFHGDGLHVELFKDIGPVLAGPIVGPLHLLLAGHKSGHEVDLRGQIAAAIFQADEKELPDEVPALQELGVDDRLVPRFVRTLWKELAESNFVLI